MLRYANNSNYKKDSMIRKEGTTDADTTHVAPLPSAAPHCPTQRRFTPMRFTRFDTSASIIAEVDRAERLEPDARMQGCGDARSRRLPTPPADRCPCSFALPSLLLSPLLPVMVSPTTLRELRRIVVESEILREDDHAWPDADENGRQELEIVCGSEHM